MQPQALRQLRERQKDSHKYDYGHVLVVGGSPGMVGAPYLSGLAALRAGAGLVTIASSPEVIDKLEGRTLEVMTLRLPSSTGQVIEIIQKFIVDSQVTSIVLGPGLTSVAMARAVISDIDVPIVVDGGALTALKGHLDLLDNPNGSFILTPHSGEMGQLLGYDLASDRDMLRSSAEKFAAEHTVILVLKGETTFVAQAGQETYANPSGNPGMATAGTGDVLAGMIAAIAGQMRGLAEATAAAVYLHGLAGDIAAEAKTQPSMIASDVIDALPEAWRRIN